jgi:antitoxin component YwqK of YwqJK toxin-antitoxin module
MRLLIFAFSFLISNSLLSQITFEPTFINQCSNKVLKFQLWKLSDSTKTYGFKSFDLKRKSLTLPKQGSYQLQIGFNEIIVDINIIENDVNRDTFFLPRITSRTKISSPPNSAYYNCETLANGKIVDYYFDGKTRMKGNFKNGQPIDTLFSFAKTGQLSEIFIPKKKGWEKTKYFKNGKIKSEEIRSKKNKLTLKEYFPNGILKRNQGHKKLEIYNQNKVIVEKIKRKEILIFERLFKKKKHGREKFYAYQWESFDDRGIIKRKIIFDSDHFHKSPFPDSVQQINDFLFEEIIFYFNGKEFKKVALELENKATLSRKLVIYRKDEKKWTREKTTSISKVHSLIENYSN